MDGIDKEWYSLFNRVYKRVACYLYVQVSNSIYFETELLRSASAANIVFLLTLYNIYVKSNLWRRTKRVI